MKSPKPFRRAAIAVTTFFVIAAGAISCQSTEPPEPASGPVEHVHTLQVTRAQLRPDAASWSVKDAKGDIELSHDSSTLNNQYTATIRLPKPLGSDTLHLRLWRLKMLTGTFPFGLVQGEFKRLGTTGRDTVASIILDRWNELNTARPAAFPERQDSSLAKAFAVLLVEGTDSLLRKGISAAPVGLDTSRVRRDALIHAASLRQPLAAIRAKWFLGLDSVQARNAILDLMPQYIPYSDTEFIFPTPPVRVTQPLALVGDLYSDSASVSVKGAFAGKKRLLGPSFVVLKEGVDQKSHFEFSQAQTPGLASTAWNLATDGGVTLRAFGNAPVGTYTLLAWMDDVDGHTDTSKLSFQVRSKPDRTGPFLTSVVPVRDSLLAFDDSVVTIQVAAADSSGVKSVTLDGRPMALAGSVYGILDTIPANGVWTERLVRAEDGLGNTSQLAVRFLRQSIGASKPKATLVDPATFAGDTIPALQEKRKVVWRITDPAGLALVTIGGKPATGTDSIWSADVDIPPTGTATTVLLQALNKNGNGVIDSVRIVRRKDTKAPSVASVAGTRTLFFDSTSAKLTWKVADDLRLDSVWINGVLQAPRADSLYSYSLSALVVGVNPVALRAKDGAGNVALDTQRITRLPNQKSPILTRLPGTADQVVAYGTDSILVRWLASGNEKIDSVAINGRRAANSKDTFAIKIALGAGTIPIVARAWNLSGNSSKDSITVESKLKDKDGNFYRIRQMPDGRVWMAQNLRTLPASGTPTCALSNCEANGALYTWSLATARAGVFDSQLAGTKDTSTVQGLCPTGWHIAKASEWSALFKATIASGVTDSGKALRSDTGWGNPGNATWGNFILPTGNYAQLVALREAADPILAPVDVISPILINPVLLTERRAYFWTPGESSAKVGMIEAFNASRSWTSTLSKTSTAGVRCIENQTRIILKKIPSTLFSP
jgi:uncharacterized protein (TIGR02145 family)